jgi:TonB family protein
MAPVLAGITIVLALAWGGAALSYGASAAGRHIIWTCALAAVLLLAPLRWRMPQRTVAPVFTANTLTTAAVTAVIATPRTHEAPRIDLAQLFASVWALGSLAMLFRLLRKSIRLRSIVRSAHGDGRILVSSQIRGPMVAGVFRPVILLPEDSESWTISRREAVLAHETAHIRRGDPAILMAAHVANALYWFHPLCRLASARLRAESERACDDAALNTGLPASGYAGHLLDLARQFDTPLAIPMATTSQLETRVKSILDPTTNRSVPARAGWLAAAALTAAVLTPLTTLTVKAQQAGSGATTIAGTATDPSGAVVPNATMTITNAESGWDRVTTTNAVGGYSFAGIPAGHYAVQAQAPGFAKFQVADVAVVSGGTAKIDARLDVGRVSQVITVAGQKGLKASLSQTSVAAPRPIRVGGMVQAARIIKQTRPVYPADLQEQGVQGSVILSAIISKQGIPAQLSVVDTAANPALVNAAIEAVNQWRYQPTLLNGEPVEVLTSIQVDFTLK